MYKIVKKEVLHANMYQYDILAPRLAESALPGQFVIVKHGEYGERVPLTITDYDREAGTVSIVFQTLGDSTQKLAKLEEGDLLSDFVGPLGNPTDLAELSDEELKEKKILFLCGGVGTAPVYPQVKYLKSRGCEADVIIGARNKDLIIYEEHMRSVAGNLYLATDDGSTGFHGNVVACMKDLIANGKEYNHIVAIGPMIMMKFATLAAKELGIPIVVSLNSIMVDGTGMCGACRVTIGDEVKFTCVDGPEFDGYLVDFDNAMQRQTMYKSEEGRKLIREMDKAHPNPDCTCKAEDSVETTELTDKSKRIPVREQDPAVRATNFEEVCYGYSKTEAMLEVQRCLDCKVPRCVQACPVHINIPGFIQALKQGNIEEAGRIIAQQSALPAICGRVCPQEEQCEGACVMGIRNEAVAIGKLERFVADTNLQNGVVFGEKEPAKGIKVAVIGSGPAGLSCAGDLAKKGYEVTVFESLHKLGGVLAYGIPEFRLPKDRIVNKEVENIKNLGVKFETDVIIGRTVTIDELMDKENFKAVFIGSGAGLPKFMHIPGESSNGVLSANEFLTRANLMKSYDDSYDTPIAIGKVCVTVGAGNVAMDAARTALRLGSESKIVYRRSEDEIPARAEEVHHAKEEGVEFNLLTNPIEILHDDKGWVTGVKCIKMELGEPDASGRRRPQEVAGSEFVIPCDTVIMSLGTNPNPLIRSTTKGLDTQSWGGIIAEESTGATSRPGVFAGGDAVTGAATVILAMGAGKQAATAIDEYLSK
ncbi:bifunctional dihydroorotate dehydrogenase B NAD binding subunit/NADPH-dependent glutamate synthase [Veillonella intestinalis]|uniref:bifunctional dihydroorotate dehydrogenase B NAD binding subunit/NADPH-dependent glutamate synthase n=1 Tax=Veillonella intestinalis TaxID=2941341 RepID=UPI00203C1719|nr:bifunctional dihydroorotate dehydrogenase B NAD binding subunit/NADPH-dependent glutamate synthase [Veillonella intestinalis]